MHASDRYHNSITYCAARRGGRAGLRRRGQALLLAVLLMVFAALLGTTFITVVAVNMNQNRRETDSTGARIASDAGIKMTNAQLTGGKEGEKWRPERLNIPPAPGDADYDEYYPPWVQAQGWARTTPHDPAYNSGLASSGGLSKTDIEAELAALETGKANGEPVFVRFPDPRTTLADTGPTYLSEVKYLTTPDESTEGTNRAGLLRMTVIGLTGDESTVFDLRKTYKPTTFKLGPLYYNQYIPHWDHANGRLIKTKIESVSIINPEITVSDVTGMAPGMSLLLQSPGTPPSKKQVIIKSIATTTRTVTFNASTGLLSSSYANGVALVASALGEAVARGTINGETAGISNFDGDYDNMYSAAYDNTVSLVHDAKTTGGLVMGGAYLNTQKLDLQLNSSLPNSMLRIFGILDPGTASADQVIRDANGNTTTQVASSSLIKTNSNFDGTDPTNANASVQKITPPALDDKFGRYRLLTKFAADNGVGGYGEGLYINNVDDYEKVSTGTGYARLSNSDLHRLWQRKSFPTKTGGSPNVYVDGTTGAIGNTAGGGKVTAHRLAFPRPDIDTYTYPLTTGSLEERGIRGWVSPWEYRARGALIEIEGDNVIYVTLDDRIDGSTLPDSSKAWTDPNGDELPNMGYQCYRMKLEKSGGVWRRSFGALGHETNTVSQTTADPFNGVIMAEGNVRVRGYYKNLDPDLTIVSMNNIYLEGNLRRESGGTGHVALLAKNNVVMNPTQFVTRLSGAQDYDVAGNTSPTSGIPLHPIKAVGVSPNGTDNVAVDDITPLRIGDRVRLGSRQKLLTLKTITNVIGITGTLTFDDTIDANFDSSVATDYVHILTDPPLNDNSDLDKDGNRAVKQKYYSLLKNDLFLRRVNFDNPGPSQNRLLTMRHIGQKKIAFTLYPHLLQSAETNNNVTIKAGGSDGIDSAEKKIQLDTTVNTVVPLASTVHAFSKDLLQVDSGATLGDDAAQTLSQLETQVAADTHPESGNVLWQMDLTAGLGSVAARRLPPLSVTGLNLLTQANVPLTISARLLWNPQPDLVTPQPVGLGSSFKWDSLLGSYPTVGAEDWRTIEQTNTAAAYNVLNTLDTDFYINDPNTLRGIPPFQVPLRWNALDLSTIGAAVTGIGDNVMGVQSEDVADLPEYRLQGLYLDNPTYGPGIAPSLEVKVDATIYAQNGSWFVIPMPALTDNVNSTTAPLKEESSHYRRPRYKITVHGNIAQNYVPTSDNDYDLEEDPDGFSQGAVRRWIDSLAYPANVDTTSVAGAIIGKDWTSIEYAEDPVPITETSKLELPVSPELLYTS